MWVADDDGVVSFRDVAPAAGPPPEPPLARLGPSLSGALSGFILEDAGRLQVRVAPLVPPDDADATMARAAGGAGRVPVRTGARRRDATRTNWPRPCSRRSAGRSKASRGRSIGNPMRDLFDDFLEELRRREAIARGEDPDADLRRRPSRSVRTRTTTATVTARRHGAPDRPATASRPVGARLVGHRAGHPRADLRPQLRPRAVDRRAVVPERRLRPGVLDAAHRAARAVPGHGDPRAGRRPGQHRHRRPADARHGRRPEPVPVVVRSDQRGDRIASAGRALGRSARDRSASGPTTSPT